MTAIIGNSEKLNIALIMFKKHRFDCLGLTEKQQIAMQYLCANEKIKEVYFGGAAGGGKSFLGITWLSLSCLAYPNTHWFVARKTKSDILTSVVQTTLPKVANKYGFNGKYQINTVKGFIEFNNGSKISFIPTEYKPSVDPDYDIFGSTEFTGGFVEEGANVPFLAYSTARTRVGRHLNTVYDVPAKVLVTSNPTRSWIYDYFFVPHRDNKMPIERLFIQSFSSDNNFIDKSYIENLETLEGELRSRLRDGNFEYLTDTSALINVEALDNIFTNTFVLNEKEKYYLTADIALEGSDLFVIFIWKGLTVVEIIEIEKSDGKEVLTAIQNLVTKYKIPNSRICFDSDGVGGFLSGFFKNAISFKGNDKAVNNENYFNFKSQCAFKIASEINENNIYISAELNKNQRSDIQKQLSQLKRDEKITEGKLRIIGKKTMKANIKKSPDHLDNFIMRAAFMLKKRSVISY